MLRLTQSQCSIELRTTRNSFKLSDQTFNTFLIKHKLCILFDFFYSFATSTSSFDKIWILWLLKFLIIYNFIYGLFYTDLLEEREREKDENDMKKDEKSVENWIEELISLSEMQ